MFKRSLYSVLIVLLTCSLSAANDFNNSVRDACNNINWATWSNFSGLSATGSINNGAEGLVNVRMTSNFNFASTPQIYNHAKFASYPATIPNTTVPQTTWAAGAGGTTEMCFSKKVTNPVLLLASLGASSGIRSKLSFSKPYVVLFDGGGMEYHDSYSLTGIEGYAIIMFPGDFDCVTINSTTPEFYTNITWGLRPPPFQIAINEVKTCDAVVLTASGGVSYQWNAGETPNAATNTFKQPGTYIVTVTDASGCKTSVSKEVKFLSTLANVSGEKNGCSKVTLVATGGVSYQWSGGETPNNAINTFTSSGNYYVVVTDALGCSYRIDQVVTVKSGPIITIIDNSPACSPNSILTATGGVSYQWDGGLTPNQATNTFTTSGTYIVTVTNAEGCSATMSKTVMIGAGQTNITGNNVGCNSVTLTATGGVNYNWDGGLTPNQATNTFTTSGTYNVTITDVKGCIITLSKPITVNPIPQVTIDEIVFIENDGAKTLNPQVNSDVISYKWFPSTGLDNPNVKNPKANPESTTIYKLTVVGAGNCIAEATIKVVVLKEIFIPNVFSPNGDGKNDQWLIRNISDYIGTKVQIFNRYGQQVFKNDNFISPWDGIMNGKPLPLGSYYYILDLANKAKTRYTGSVTILR
ncbi:gliding motility-associated C-terminal domain-containing protein [Pedobacter sp.]